MVFYCNKIQKSNKEIIPGEMKVWVRSSLNTNFTDHVSFVIFSFGNLVHLNFKLGEEIPEAKLPRASNSKTILESLLEFLRHSTCVC